MTYSIQLSIQAEMQANEAGIYYDEKVPGLSFRFFDDLSRSLQSITNYPSAFHSYPPIPQIRRYNLEVFPYAIYFTIDLSYIKVLAILHQRRSQAYIKQKLK